MNIPLDEILFRGYFVPFLLIMFRMLAFFSVAPLFSASGFPNQGKITLAAILALIILFLRGTSQTPVDLDLWGIAQVSTGEILIGLVLGFMVGLLFAAMQLAGFIMGYQMGFAIANVLDPVGGQQSSVLGQFFFLFGLLTFLDVNGHHLVILGMVESYDIVPIGSASANLALVDFMGILFQNYFFLAIKLALPVLGIILMIDVSLGIVARTVPQMNVFLIGMPLKTLVGIVTLLISFSFLHQLMKMEVYSMVRDFYSMIRAMV